MTIAVTALYVHPVKGLRGNAVTAAMAEPWGLAGDRRWMVVDENGRFISQRERPVMARIVATPQPDGLMLENPGMASAGTSGKASGKDSIAVPFPPATADLIEVTVWHSSVSAQHAKAADAWLSAALDTPCRLVFLADPQARPVDPEHGEPHDRVSFADGFPLLLTAEASLADLNHRLPQPVPMRRFRPNLVIAGTEAWDEDHWRRIRIADVVFRLPKPCSRCLVTSIDQVTGERPHPREPLHTLATFRRTQGGSMFGQNMIPENEGRIAIGDLVTVLESGPSNVVPETVQR